MSMQINGEAVNEVVFNGQQVSRVVCDGNRIHGDIDYILVITNGFQMANVTMNMEGLLGGGTLGEIANQIIPSILVDASLMGVSLFNFTKRIKVGQTSLIHRLVRSSLGGGGSVIMFGTDFFNTVSSTPAVSDGIYTPGEVHSNPSLISESNLRRLLEQELRSIMIRDNSNGIAVDPSRHEHQEINIISKEESPIVFNLSGYMKGVTITGLSDFIVNLLQLYHPLMVTEITVPKLRIVGERYMWSGELGAIQLYGEGSFEVEIEDIKRGAFACISTCFVDEVRPYFPDEMSEEDIALGIVFFVNGGPL